MPKNFDVTFGKVGLGLLRKAAALVMIGAIVFLPRIAHGESIQLRQEGGTYLVPVRINGAITLDFLIDTGASEVTIPADVFLTLLRTHTVGENDFLGTGRFVLADGSERASKRFRLREVRVGNHTLSNVVANVAPVQSEYPLLGQSFLSKLSSWSIDNDRGVLILSDQVAPTSPPTDKVPDALGVVRAFYKALGQANGLSASSLVIPEKRATGPFSAADISRFYGSLTEPLRLAGVKLSGPNVALAEYTYVLPSGRRCSGTALVNLTVRGAETLIESIRALAGC